MGDVIAAAERTLQHSSAASQPQPNYFLPTAKVSVTPVPGLPTTLGASAGQFGPKPRARNLGLWIVGGAVVFVAAMGIAFIAASKWKLSLIHIFEPTRLLSI